MTFYLHPLFSLLLLVLFGVSIWGGVVLARSWAKERLGRIVLGLVLIVVFWTASIVAVISGCTAVVGPPSFR